MRINDHIRMIPKHLCLSGMLGRIKSKINWFCGYILLPLLCSMSLISPNFDVKSIIFSQFWSGAFSQNYSHLIFIIIVTQFCLIAGGFKFLSVSPSAFGQNVYLFIFEPWHEISNNLVCATSKGSDQPAHTHRLIRAFAGRLNILWLLNYWLTLIWGF